MTQNRPPTLSGRSGAEVATTLLDNNVPRYHVVHFMLALSMIEAGIDPQGNCPFCHAAESGLDPCPECRQGKHGNCDGLTWDDQADDLAPCPCYAAGHVRGA
jgi:hypothetical protein